MSASQVAACLKGLDGSGLLMVLENALESGSDDLARSICQCYSGDPDLSAAIEAFTVLLDERQEYDRILDDKILDKVKAGEIPKRRTKASGAARRAAKLIHKYHNRRR